LSKVIKRTLIDDVLVASPAFCVPTDRPELSFVASDEDEFVSEEGGEAAIEEAEARAKEIIARSRREADLILKDAKAEAESIAKRAEKEGYELGQAAGLAQVREAYAEALNTIDSVADSIVTAADALVSGCECEVAKLAVAVAEKLVRKTIDEDPEAVLCMIREAVRRTEGARTVVMRVSPADLEVVARAHNELIGLSPDLRSLEIVEDARIERGGCVIEMEVGSVDARIDEQLREVERSFLEEAEHAR
jgi:flagellar assembly protein FliH